MCVCVKDSKSRITQTQQHSLGLCPAPHQIERRAENDRGGQGRLRSLFAQVVGQDAPAVGPASRQDGAVGVALPHPGNDFPDAVNGQSDGVLCVRGMPFSYKRI